MSKHIEVGGLVFLATDDFDESDAEDMAALTALGEYLASRIPKLTPEQEAKQAASRERIRTRNARLRLLDGDDDA